MGHEFCCGTGRTKQEAQSDLISSSRHTDEYGHGLSGVKWVDKVFDSEDVAYEYIEEKSHDLYFSGKGLGAGYKKYNIKPTATLHKLREACRQTGNDYVKANRIIHYKATTTQKTVTCKGCGTRYMTANLYSNTCQRCGRDMRPASVLQKLETLKKKNTIAEQKYKAKLAEIQSRSKSEILYICGGYVHS